MPALALGFFNCQQFHIPSEQPTEGILSRMESYECITELLDGNLVCFPVDSLLLSSAFPKQKCTHRPRAEGTWCMSRSWRQEGSITQTRAFLQLIPLEVTHAQPQPL